MKLCPNGKVDHFSFSINLNLHIDDGSIVSISFLQIVDSTQFDELLEIFKLYIDKKADDYTGRLIVKFILSHHIYDKNSDIKSRLVKPDFSNKIAKFTFSGYKLPLTTDIFK